MPPTILRRTESDVSRRYWWVILIVLLALGAVSLVMLPKGSGPGPAGGDGSAGLASEQGLESIDDGLKTIGAPGGPINLSMEGAGAYQRRDGSDAGQKSSLYESPTAAVGPGAAATVSEAGSSASGGTLAEALKKVASSKPDRSDNKGWGSAAVRTGFSRPQAKFNSLSGPGGGGGGGGSGASLGVGGVTNPYGIATSNPGSGSTVGLGAGGGGGGDFKVRKGGRNQAFDHLKQVQNVAGKAAGAGGDLAANLGSRGFDAASARGGLAGGGTAASGGSVVGGPDAVPENLKLDDPKLQNKKIEVPAIGKDKSANPRADMERQMVMMLMMAAIGGIAGPMFGAIGVGMANMMFNQNMKATYNIAPPPTSAPR